MKNSIIILAMFPILAFSQVLTTETTQLDKFKQIQLKGISEVEFQFAEENTITFSYYECDGCGGNVSISKHTDKNQFSLALNQKLENFDTNKYPSKVIVAGDLNELETVILKKVNHVKLPKGWHEGQLKHFETTTKTTFERNVKMKPVRTSTHLGEIDLDDVQNVKILGFDKLIIQKGTKNEIQIQSNESAKHNVNLDKNGSFLTVELTEGRKKGTSITLTLADKLKMLQVLEVNHFDLDFEAANIVIRSNDEKNVIEF